jgi:hypothetical protein
VELWCTHHCWFASHLVVIQALHYAHNNHVIYPAQHVYAQMLHASTSNATFTCAIRVVAPLQQSAACVARCSLAWGRLELGFVNLLNDYAFCAARFVVETLWRPLVCTTISKSGYIIDWCCFDWTLLFVGLL